MKHRHVFVCGLHRSGTSVLARSLGHHPQVSGFQDTGAVEDEGQYLQSVYLPGIFYGGPGLFGFDPRAHLDETSPLVSAENAARLQRDWERYWDTRCPVLLEKSPPNLVHTRFLQAMFPDACFVVILRHPIAVTLSTKNRGGIPLFTLIEHWLVCHERFMSDRAYLDRVHVLWYEDLMERPGDKMDEIWRFLELESVSPAEPLLSHNTQYIARWNELSHKALRGTHLNWIKRRFEARVAAFGYSLIKPKLSSHRFPVDVASFGQPPSRFSRSWAAAMACWVRFRLGGLRALNVG